MRAGGEWKVRVETGEWVRGEGGAGSGVEVRVGTGVGWR